MELHSETASVGKAELVGCPPYIRTGTSQGYSTCPIITEAPCNGRAADVLALENGRRVF